MNLAFQDLPVDEFRYNVKFLEKKRNLIMEGDFVKLVYSDESMAINSIFFVCPFKCKHEDDAKRAPSGAKPEQDCAKGAIAKDPAISAKGAIAKDPAISAKGAIAKDPAISAKRRKEEESTFEKCTIWFAPYDPVNQRIIEQLIQYEQALVDEYVVQTHCRKTPTMLLKNQLLSGNIRLYRMHQPSTSILVKLSGIWESNENFGITYKFIECN
jgi:hypothetical protein